MIERRHGEYGLRGILWVARAAGGPDRAVIARGRVNTYRVYGIANGTDLYLRKEFYAYDAACAFAETLVN